MKKYIGKIFNTRDPGYASLSIMLCFMGTIIITILVSALLSVAMIMSQQHDVDDALADSTLAACLVDDWSYAQGREDESFSEFGDGRNNVTLKFRDPDYSLKLFKKCFEDEVNYENSRFFEDLKIEQFILYEVSGDGTTVRTYKYNGVSMENCGTGSYPNVKTPDGEVVKRTSVYSKVSFTVHMFFVKDLSSTRYRTLYSTVKAASVPHISDDYWSTNYDVSDNNP